MPRGGARPGAGRKSAKQWPEVVERARVLREYRLRVCKKARELLALQLASARGLSYVYKRLPPSYKAVRVTDPQEIEDFLTDPESERFKGYYHIVTEGPDTKTIMDMLDRTFGRAPQTMTLQGDEEGGPIRTTVIIERATDEQ